VGFQENNTPPLGETTPLAKESTAVDVCDFEEDTKPSSKTVVDLQLDSAKVAPLSNTVIDLQEEDTSDSNESDKNKSEYWKSLITQCNWRFEHCFLRLTPLNRCQQPGGCNNFTHVRCAALWSLKNKMTIDDPKTVGLWCKEHYLFYCQLFPPEETDNRTDCRWKWTGNKQERLWSVPDIEETNSNGLWFAPMCTDCFLVNKYIGIGEEICNHPWKEHQLNATGK
jgi:hypothetical protein